MKAENEYGYIEYNKPNMLDGLEFLGKMGIASSDLMDGKKLMENDLYYTSQAIKNMKPFLTKIECKVDDKEIKTYEDAINCIQLMGLLIEVSVSLMSFMQVDSKKKLE